MAIQPGDNVSADVVNAEFLSKPDGGDIAGVVSLSEPSSGGDIANLQLALNSSLLRASFANQAVTSNGFITINTASVQYRRVSGDGAANTANNQPFGTTASSFAQGKMIELIGTDSTDTITIPYSDTQYGCLVNGDATLSAGNILVLIYDDVLERFLEYSRNF